MSEFNMSSWLKDQYLTEAGLGSTKSQSLANAINTAMLQIDDSMSYTDFAEAVASILIDEYGTHNFAPFMEVLHARLGMNTNNVSPDIEDMFDYQDRVMDMGINKSINEDKGDDALAKEIDSRFGGNPRVSNGRIKFRMKDEFSDGEWGEILNLIKSKGFEIIKDSNYYDIEPGEREWFPTIDFKLK